jgi:hypothetical protein
MSQRIRALLGVTVAVLMQLPCNAGAAVSAVPDPSAFPADTLQVGLQGIPNDTPAHGLTVDGILFTYSLGPDKLFVEVGPSDTNNVRAPSIVSRWDDSGTVTLELAQPAHWFGFGFALLADQELSDGASVSVFSGVQLLGTLTFPAIRDPAWPGGFAGLFSSAAFDRVDLRFNSTDSFAFAADNFRVSAVPEPTPWTLAAAGAVLLALRARRVRI